MRTTILSSLILCIASYAYSASYFVGAGLQYDTPNSIFQAAILSDGDTIILKSGTYSGTDALAVWQVNDLVIMGESETDRAVLDADGEYIWGKGIWVAAGNNLTVYNVEFKNAQVPDFNGAGIRLDGAGLTIYNCYFHHNEMGILTNSSGEGTVRVQASEFAYNGYGDGFSHNIYVNHVDSFVFSCNYSHHSVIGHTLKSRADHNVITYNKFEDGPDGNSSRLIDLPNGGISIIMGNELLQGPNAENINLIGYGLEGLTNDVSHELYIVNNTFHNLKTTNGLFLHIEDGSDYVKVANNVMIGIGDLVVGTIDEDAYNVVNAVYEDQVFEGDGDDKYYLTDLSPLNNTGQSAGTTLAGDFVLEPSFQWYNLELGCRELNTETFDIGAHNFFWITNQHEVELQAFQLTPNPAKDQIRISLKDGRSHDYSYQLINHFGQRIQMGKLVNETLDISTLLAGQYYLLIDNQAIPFVKTK